MRKEYRSSNVRFCMDDENQRRTWEYLQSITKKKALTRKYFQTHLFRYWMETMQ